MLTVIHLDSFPLYLDTSIREHADSSIKKRAPSIRALANKYNKAVEDAQMKAKSFNFDLNLIPAPLDVANLYNLDSNPHMWAASEILSQSADHPAYLINEDIRRGIAAVLARDRAKEELIRLREELKTSISWLKEQIRTLQEALVNCQGAVLLNLDQHMFLTETS